MKTTSTQDSALLEAVRGGSEDAFRRLVEEHQPALHAHCYRMLGSLHDAEDALQDTLLRAWRGLPRFAGRSSLRTWLYSIATNSCMDVLARRKRRILPSDQGEPSAPSLDFDPPLVESVWVEPYPDQTLGVPAGQAGPEARYEQLEAVELAFVASLQHLPATQRAVLILRDVLGFSAREVSDSLDTTVVSVNSALQRARKTLEQRLPERSQQETLRSLGDERSRALIEAYLDAWGRADVDALKTMLAEDAVFSMPPWSMWWRGGETIAEYARVAHGQCPETRSVPITANGQLGFAHYGLDPETARYTATAIDVYTLEGSRIREITAFVSPAIFSRFGLPEELGT